MIPRSAACVVLWPALVLAQSAAPQRPFRARAEEVIVDVSVRHGNSAVLGLAADDFALFDNGVRQQVDVVFLDTVPIDVTLFLDTSGSTAGALPAMVKAVHGIAEKLRPGDRFRVLTIGRSVYESVPWTDAGTSFDLDLTFVEGLSLIHDALAAAIRHPVAPGRRHVVVALTDGEDCGSIVSPHALEDLAARADAVVHWVRMGVPMRGDLPGARARCLGDLLGADPDVMAAVAARTGGATHSGLFGADPVRAFDEVLTEFRQSYVLAFTPTGVASGGWHALRVEVPKAKYWIHARSGYER